MESLLLFIILAIVQGITEPIPVSSSGHLVLVKSMFNFESNDATLEILLHAGSLVAIIWFYKDDILPLIKQGLSYPITRKKADQPYFIYGLKLVLATIPAGIVGLLFKDQITSLLSNPKAVGAALLYTGTLLAFTAFTLKKRKQQVGFFSSFIIGVAQAIALIPGVSRSGSTISSAMMMKVDAKEAMKFSMLLFIPIAIVVVITGLVDLGNSPYLSNYIYSYIIATIVSGVVTYYAMNMLGFIIKKQKYHWFSLYCFVVGFLAIVLL